MHCAGYIDKAVGRFWNGHKGELTCLLIRQYCSITAGYPQQELPFHSKTTIRDSCLPWQKKKKKKEILYGFAMASLPKTQPLQRSSNNRVNQDVLRPPLFSSCFILHLESWITKLIITVSLLPISSVFLPTVLLQAGREATQPCVKPGNYSSVIIATKGNR